MQYTSTYQSPLGAITLAGDGTCLRGLWFQGAKYYAATLDQAHEERETPILKQAADWLDRYFQGENPGDTPPVGLTGSPFRMAVWSILRQIPYGQVITYGEIAARLARQQGVGTVSAQAVGGAVGRNPISIIVPCHRVVGGGGSLTGYAGGVEKKARLLKLEKADLTRLTVPRRGTAL